MNVDSSDLDMGPEDGEGFGDDSSDDEYGSP
jgi:hypothetical protein